MPCFRGKRSIANLRCRCECAKRKSGWLGNSDQRTLSPEFETVIVLSDEFYAELVKIHLTEPLGKRCLGFFTAPLLLHELPWNAAAGSRKP